MAVLKIKDANGNITEVLALNGKTPYIKNGNWWFDNEDTGVKAEARDGVDGTVSFDELTQEQRDSLRGVSGVYVGSGEMPEGYNVQIDPNGTDNVFDIDIDLDYNPLSTNAQSGFAVAQAIKAAFANLTNVAEVGQ